MSILDSLNRSIRNVFVGSHKDEDIKDEWFENRPHNPLDDMPIANGDNKYAPPERRAELEMESSSWYDNAPSEYEPPMQDSDWFIEKPDESDEIEEEKTMHQKMYEIATAKYNPFAIGGSENLGGGSEERLEEEFTPENDPFGGY